MDDSASASHPLAGTPPPRRSNPHPCKPKKQRRVLRTCRCKLASVDDTTSEPLDRRWTERKDKRAVQLDQERLVQSKTRAIAASSQSIVTLQEEKVVLEHEAAPLDAEIAQAKGEKDKLVRELKQLRPSSSVGAQAGSSSSADPAGAGAKRRRLS